MKPEVTEVVIQEGKPKAVARGATWSWPGIVNETEMSTRTSTSRGFTQRTATRMPKTIQTNTPRDMACRNTLTRAAGNNPFGSARWTAKYRNVPVTSTAMPNAMSVAPNGRANDSTAIPLCKGLFALVLTETRKSCTRATPADANARLVRTYAKKVRSDARWSRATEPVFCRVSERMNGRAAAGETSSLSAFRLVDDVGADGPSSGSSASMRE